MIVLCSRGEKITKDMKRTAQELLAPYFTEKYGDNVRHPAVLLNFLQQHNVIKKPNYIICKDPKHHYYRAVCKTDDFEEVGFGCTKKEAIKNSAQKVINFLINDLDENNVEEESGIFLESSSDTNESKPSQDLSEMNELISRENCCDYSSTVEPQMETDCFFDDTTANILKHSSDFISSNVVQDKNNSHNSLLMCNINNNELSDLVNSDNIVRSLDPFGRCLKKKIIMIDENKCEVSLTKSNNQSSNLVITPDNIVRTLDPFEQYFNEVHKNNANSEYLTKSNSQYSNLIANSNNVDPLEQCFETESTTKHKNSSTNNEVIVSFSNSLVKSFDPTVNENNNSNHEVTTVNENNNTNHEVTPVNLDSHMEFHDSSEQGYSKNLTLVHQNDKNPAIKKSSFQLLYENSLKKYKLIPRISMEKVDSKFRCTIQLDSNKIFGEGSSKKLAKEDAAAKLLDKVL